MERAFAAGTGVYRNPRAVPRAFVASRYVSLADDAKALRWIASPQMSPSNTVVLTGPQIRRLPSGFLHGLRNEHEGLETETLRYDWGDRDREPATDDPSERRKFELYHASWGWTAGDSAEIRVRAPQMLAHSYLIVSYFADSENSSSLSVREYTENGELDVPVTLPGFEPGQQPRAVARTVNLDLGSVGPRGFRLAVTRPPGCRARIESVRIASSHVPVGETSGNASVTSLEPNTISLEANLNRPGLLVISDVYYPGWEAQVDGEHASVVEVDYCLKAVPVGAGTHRIRVRFRPDSFVWGLSVTLLTCFSIGVWLIPASAREMLKRTISRWHPKILTGRSI
jgi:hypothetical protein